MRYDPFEWPDERDEDGEDGDEEGWDVALVHLWTKLDEIVLDGQPSGGSSLEKALIATITKTAKDELKRSVSCIFYCVFARLSTNFVILATAAPAHQGW